MGSIRGLGLGMRCKLSSSVGPTGANKLGTFYSKQHSSLAFVCDTSQLSEQPPRTVATGCIRFELR